MADVILKVKSVLGPTIGGRKPLLYLDDAGREVILREIQSEWKALIGSHFRNQGHGTIRWRPLDDRYLKFKKAQGLGSGLLIATTPKLETRYKRSIKYDARSFKIWIVFPPLVTGPNRIPVRETSKTPKPAHAGVHQAGLGKVKRRLVKKAFIDVARSTLIKGLTKDL